MGIWAGVGGDADVISPLTFHEPVASYAALSAVVNPQDGDYCMCLDTGLVVRYFNGALDDANFVPDVWLPAWAFDGGRPSVLLDDTTTFYAAFNENVQHNVGGGGQDIKNAHGWAENLVGGATISIVGNAVQLDAPNGVNTISFWFEHEDPASKRVLLATKVTFDSLVAALGKTTLIMRGGVDEMDVHFQPSVGDIGIWGSVANGKGEMVLSDDTWFFVMLDWTDGKAISHIFHPNEQAQAVASMERDDMSAIGAVYVPYWWLNGSGGAVRVTISQCLAVVLSARAS